MYRSTTWGDELPNAQRLIRILPRLIWDVGRDCYKLLRHGRSFPSRRAITYEDSQGRQTTLALRISLYGESPDPSESAWRPRRS